VSTEFVLQQRVWQLERIISSALSLADNTDGAHHKQWTIDQMVRVLAGEDYGQWVMNYEHCGKVPCPTHDGGQSDWDCDEGYAWDEGIAP